MIKAMQIMTSVMIIMIMVIDNGDDTDHNIKGKWEDFVLILELCLTCEPISFSLLS